MPSVYRQIDKAKLEQLRERNPNNFEGLDIRRNYLNARNIDMNNFDELYDPMEMTEILVKNKRGGDTSWLEKLQKEALTISNESELGKKEVGGKRLTAEEKFLLELYWEEAISAKKDKIEYLIEKKPRLTPEEKEKLQQKKDKINDKIKVEINKIIPTEDRDTVSSQFKKIEELIDALMAPSLDLAEFKKDSDKNKSITKEDAEEKFREINEKLKEIAHATPKNPEIAGLISEYYDLSIIVDDRLQLTQGMKEYLADQKQKLEKEVINTREKKLNLEVYVRSLATVKDLTKNTIEQSLPDFAVDTFKSSSKLLKSSLANLKDSPFWVKALGVVFTLVIAGKIANTKDETVQGLKKLGKWGLIFGGIAAVASYAHNKKGPIKNLERWWSGKETTYGENLGTDTVQELYGPQLERIPKKRRQSVKSNMIRFVVETNEQMKGLSAWDIIRQYKSLTEDGEVSFTVPGMGSKKDITDVLRVFFAKDTPESIIAKHGEAKLKGMTFNELFENVNAESGQRLIHVPEIRQGIAGSIRRLADSNRIHLYHSGIFLPLLSDRKTLKKDVKEARKEVKVAGAAGPSGTLAESGFWNAVKRTAAGSWFEIKNGLNWGSETWAFDWMVPDSWFENFDRQKGLIKQISVENIDDREETDLAGKKERVAEGSINFLKGSMVFTEYGKMFIEPPSATRKYETLREFHLEKTPGAPPLPKKAYVTTKTVIGDQFEVSDEARLKNALTRAIKQAQSIAQKNGVTEDQLKYAQIIDAVIFSNQLNKDGKSAEAIPELRVFIRIPLGNEYARLKTERGRLNPGSAFEAGKTPDSEILDEANPLKLDRDFPNTIDRLHLLKIFPVDTRTPDGVKKMHDILKFLTKDYTKNSAPQLKRSAAREKVLQIETTQIEEIIKKTEFEEQKKVPIRIPPLPRYSIPLLYGSDGLLKFQQYGTEMKKIEDEVIDDTFYPIFMGVSNPEVIEKKFRENELKTLRAIYQLALMSLENDIAVHPTGPLLGLISDSAQRDKIINQVNGALLGKKLTGGTYTRSADQILDYYRKELEKAAENAKP